MAIARGAGTEIIRSASFKDIDATNTKLIIGVQHHIYTVLSVIMQVNAVNAVGDRLYLRLYSYDSKAGTTNVEHRFVNWVMTGGQTYVFNDKFSFNGYEPTNFTGPMDDAAKQDAIADQGSGVSQYLMANTSHAGTDVSVLVTYIDQNNA